MFSEMSLENKTILITGGSNGIGYEFCKIILEKHQSTKLIVIDLQQPKFDCIYYKCDLSSKEETKSVFTSIHNNEKLPDVFIFNAGVQYSKLLEDYTEEEYERVIDVNFKNLYYSIRPFLKDLKSRNSGHLIYTCSVCSFIAAPGSIPYSASKAGAFMFANGLRTELDEFNIKVSTLTPGHVNGTSLFKEYKNDYQFLMPSLTPEYVGNGIYKIVQNNYSQQWMKPLYTLIGPLTLLLPPSLLLYLQRLTGADVAIIRKNK